MKAKSQPTNKRYATAPEVARLYRTSPAVIYTWAREGRFPSNAVLRIGRKILWDLDALEAWAARGGSPAPTHNEVETV